MGPLGNWTYVIFTQILPFFLESALLLLLNGESDFMFVIFSDKYQVENTDDNTFAVQFNQ